MSKSRITRYSSTSITLEQACKARAHAWKFIFDTYRKKAAEQDNAKTKQKV
jgi:hypothetical protein